MAGSQAVRNAEKFVKNRTTMMIGLSCGNSFFDKVENLQKILKFAKENSDEVRIKDNVFIAVKTKSVRFFLLSL